MDRLLRPVRDEQETERQQLLRKQVGARAQRQAAVQFDIQQAMAAGDLDKAMKLQTGLHRAEAVDRAAVRGLNAQHQFDRDVAAERERDSWENFTGTSFGLQGRTKRAGDVIELPRFMVGMKPSAGQLVADEKRRVEGSGEAWTLENQMDAGYALGSQKMVRDAARGMKAPVKGPDFDNPDPSRRNRAAFELALSNQRADQMARYKSGQLPAEVRQARAIGALSAAKDLQSDMAGMKAVPVDVRGGVAYPNLSQGGIIETGDGQRFRVQGRKRTPTFDEPFTGVSGARQRISY